VNIQLSNLYSEVSNNTQLLKAVHEELEPMTRFNDAKKIFSKLQTTCYSNALARVGAMREDQLKHQKMAQGKGDGLYGNLPLNLPGNDHYGNFQIPSDETTTNPQYGDWRSLVAQQGKTNEDLMPNPVGTNTTQKNAQYGYFNPSEQPKKSPWTMAIPSSQNSGTARPLSQIRPSNH
jgi:hypothetical protein